MSKGYELECIVGWRAMTDIWRREEAEEPRWLFKPLEPRAWCWCNRSLDASRSRWWQHLPLWRSLEPCLEIKQIKDTIYLTMLICGVTLCSAVSWLKAHYFFMFFCIVKQLHNTIRTAADTYPRPWRSWRACRHPLPTRRGRAWCRGLGRCRGTGGLGELSGRYGSRPGWGHGACTWRSGGRTCTCTHRNAQLSKQD